MPLKAVIFHGNVVQPSEQSARAQRSARRGSVLDWFSWCSPGGLSPALVPHSPAPRSEPRRKYRLRSLFSPPLTGTDCCRPTPGTLMMRSGGEVSCTRKDERSTRKTLLLRALDGRLFSFNRHFGVLPKCDKRCRRVIQNVVSMQRNSKSSRWRKCPPGFPMQIDSIISINRLSWPWT